MKPETYEVTNQFPAIQTEILTNKPHEPKGLKLLRHGGNKYNNMNIKHLTVCLFAACSLQASAQYLEHIYDYIENTTVFEENQEETLPRNICR